eukprot:03969.XXX_164271_164372_1 [CDS] Oithona nana genome sequencing.
MALITANFLEVTQQLMPQCWTHKTQTRPNFLNT